ERARFPPELERELAAEPALLAALARSPRPEVRIAVAALFGDDRGLDAPVLGLGPAQRALLFELMASSDDVVALAATTAAMGAGRGERCDAAVQAELERRCASEPRPLVRGAACAGVVHHLHPRLHESAAAEDVAAAALADPEPWVAVRTLEELSYASLDPRHQGTLLALLGHVEPAVRGLAALVVGRSVRRAAKPVPEAVERARAALAALLADADPFVRCEAVLGLGSDVHRGAYGYVEAAIGLFGDDAAAATALAYRRPTLGGAKDARWELRSASPTVADCAKKGMLLKARIAEGAVTFDAWELFEQKGADVVREWWKPLHERLKHRR
ncbi:MAG: hypothetical protein HY908_11630, partial [Myxococcales bacterium]|nr:hypothetical protein [Myxococcales bacterium]